MQTNADKKSPSATSKTPAATAAAAAAHVGTTITVAGNVGGEKISATVVKVVPKTLGANQFTKPETGKQFAAVQLRLQNVGTASYTDSPSNGAKVIDGQGQSFASYVAETTAGSSFASGLVNLAPGATALGVISFQVPIGTKIVRVQWGTDSGFGRTGEWIVP